MLVCILLILGTWNGVMGTDDICNIPSYRACAIPEETRNFPKTEEDINRQCPYVAQHLECLKDYADKCGYENVHQEFSEEKHQTLKNLVEDICQKDSQLHLRIVQNIGCISELMDNFQNECREYLRNKTAMLRQYTRNKEVEENYDESTYNVELWRPFLCVTESLGVACFASEASKRCGSDTRGLVLELVARSGSIKEACPPVVGDRINELIRLLELEIEEERLLNEIINKE
ncbi:hypothetical protein AVEN_184515-1 [Araneus ventricosus]|uniref:DUF19 domain-containing protein n=1 Tax=Araneus ventricosus TaxID=182803 RepID=A0A4Y2SN98_ARAVE|nr:hypothetical protein AVEN_184515-1 [Araneus ventricosus]